MTYFVLGSISNPKLTWYVARASGITCWVVVTVSIMWGLLLSARILNRHTAPGWLLDLHRYLGALSIVFMGVHVGALVADNWLHFGWTETLVPMSSTWRPGAVAWGIAAFYMLAAIELTSLLKRWIPRKLWRATHVVSFPLFAASTVHGIQAGKDSSNRAYGALTVMLISIVIVLGLLRIVATRDARLRASARKTPGASTDARQPETTQVSGNPAGERDSSRRDVKIA
jgi:predicted ferric reductase